MFSDATKQIMEMMKQAENKKSYLKQVLRNLELKRERDKEQLHRDEIIASQARRSPNIDTARALLEIYEDKKQVMDDDHEISEMKLKIVDADRKIAEMKHWTSQSEYEDPNKRAQAVNLARRALNSF